MLHFILKLRSSFLYDFDIHFWQLENKVIEFETLVSLIRKQHRSWLLISWKPGPAVAYVEIMWRMSTCGAAPCFDRCPPHHPRHPQGPAFPVSNVSRRTSPSARHQFMGEQSPPAPATRTLYPFAPPPTTTSSERLHISNPDSTHPFKDLNISLSLIIEEISSELKTFLMEGALLRWHVWVKLCSGAPDETLRGKEFV